jgi:hypothetical protein
LHGENLGASKGMNYNAQVPFFSQGGLWGCISLLLAAHFK